MLRLIGIGMLLLSLSTTTVNAQIETFTSEQKEEITKFIKTISGVYNNQAQSDTTQSPLLGLSEIRAFEIWTHKKNEYWISIGWYQPNFPDLPIGEKIFHIKSASNDTLWLDCYSWGNTEDEELLLQWQKKHPYEKQKIDALVNDGCESYITKNSRGHYELKTVEHQICSFNNSIAPFDGISFYFVFEGKAINIYNKNYKKELVVFHYEDAPMLMQKIDETALAKEKELALEMDEKEEFIAAVRLKKGDKANQFYVDDVKGNKISLKKILRENKVLLIFLRHAWCPVCNHRTHELMDNYKKLKEKGYEVIVVYESSAKNLLPYVNDYKLPYTVIADPDHKLYEAYLVEFSFVKIEKGRTNKKMLDRYQKGNKLFKGRKYKREGWEETSTIIPADFIVDKNQKIELSYYGEFIGDHLPVKDLLIDVK